MLVGTIKRSSFVANCDQIEKAEKAKKDLGDLTAKVGTLSQCAQFLSFPAKNTSALRANWNYTPGPWRSTEDAAMKNLYNKVEWETTAINFAPGVIPPTTLYTARLYKNCSKDDPLIGGNYDNAPCGRADYGFTKCDTGGSSILGGAFSSVASSAVSMATSAKTLIPAAAAAAKVAGASVPR